MQQPSNYYQHQQALLLAQQQQQQQQQLQEAAVAAAAAAAAAADADTARSNNSGASSSHTNVSSAATQHSLDDVDDSDDDQNSKPGNKRSGRRKIKIEYIEDKSRRHITFSKRKAGIMKKAYELSTLTGTQVLLLVVSETGLVYTFTTPKLQPLVTKPEGKNLIQSCLNAPDITTPEANAGTETRLGNKMPTTGGGGDTRAYGGLAAPAPAAPNSTTATGATSSSFANLPYPAYLQQQQQQQPSADSSGLR